MAFGDPPIWNTTTMTMASTTTDTVIRKSRNDKCDHCSCKRYYHFDGDGGIECEECGDCFDFEEPVRPEVELKKDVMCDECGGHHHRTNVHISFPTCFSEIVEKAKEDS